MPIWKGTQRALDMFFDGRPRLPTCLSALAPRPSPLATPPLRCPHAPQVPIWKKEVYEREVATWKANREAFDGVV